MSDILDSLPEAKFFRKCSHCGSNEWEAALLNADNRVVLQCSDCPDAPERVFGCDNCSIISGPCKKHEDARKPH